MTRAIAFAAALFLAAGGSAVAQTSLDQQTAGIVRGIQAENSSGQNGEFAIYRGSKSVVIDMKGTRGRAEVVTIERGVACGRGSQESVASLGTLHRGHLNAMAPMSLKRLLSGSYNLVVHNNTAGSRSVACGHIYLPT
jgi:hypothetical protein